MLAVWTSALVALCGCDELSPPRVDYRPEEAGTVDHALCLLGFRAVPLRRLSTGHQMVELELNGRPATFVVDTGANMTVLHDGHAERFGLTPARSAPVAAIALGGPLQARQAGVDMLSIGGIRIRRSRIVVASLAQVTGSLARFTGSEIHGILGQDVMGEHRAVIEADQDPAPVAAERCRVAGESETRNEAKAR